MCGILAVRIDWLQQAHGGIDEAVGRAMAALRPRGPDGARWIRHGHWVLGCTRLAISEPRSAQPVVLRGGRWAGAFNGAVTNAREAWQALRPALAQRARLPNDAWLALLAAARAGEAAPPPFAFHGHGCALVADAGTDTLHVLADPLGEKPLFAAVRGGFVVALASTPAALHALGLASPVGGWRGSTHWTRGSGWPADAVADGIRTWDRAMVRASVVGGRVAAMPAPAVPARPHANLREVVGAAVRRCATADVPVGFALSGGLDSSILAAALAREGHALDAIHFHAAGEPGDERERARVVARRHGHRLHEVEGDASLLDALPRLTRTWGFPLGDPSVLALHAVARRAADVGVRVLLSGEGADEGFVGYERHRAAALLARWRHVLRLARPLVPAWSTGRFTRLVRAACSVDPYGSLLQVVPPAFLDLVLQPGWAPQPVPHPVSVADAARRDRSEYLREDLLVKLDVGAMAAGVEGRCPFLDRDVVAWAAAQPVPVLLGKEPLRAAFRTELPAEVLHARKQGMALPLDRWFRTEPRVLDVLLEPRTLQREHLRPGGVARAVDLHRSGRADLGHGLYLLLAFEHHLRVAEQGVQPCG